MGSVEHEVEIHVAALAASVADSGGGGEVPDPGFETKIRLGQGPHGTDVHYVGRVGIVEYLAGAKSQLGLVPAVEDAELAGPGDLVCEAHAAGAEDAAFLIQHHVGAEFHGLSLFDLVLPEARVIDPEVHVEVLQVALT